MRRIGSRAATVTTAVALLALVLPVAARGQERSLLELRPQVGDTLVLRLDQQSRVTVMRLEGRTVAAKHTVETTLRLLSRAVVLARQGSASTVLTLTDSVRLTTSDPHAVEAARRTERTLAGRRLLLHVAPDGAARMDGDGTGTGISALVQAMPAALPAQPVAVGERWTREMPLPAVPGRSAGEGIVRAVFRLDSLTAGGALAWLSMRGEVDRTDADADARGEELRGTVTGTLVLDRRRGWLTDTRFHIEVKGAMAGGQGGPVHFVTTITQRTRVLDRK